MKPLALLFVLLVAPAARRGLIKSRMRHAAHLARAAALLSLGCAAALFACAPWSSSRAQASPQAGDGPPRLKNFDPRLRRNTEEKPEATANKKSGDEDDVIRVETTLVVSDVLVLDKQGRAVRGLRREDFAVREDGAPQEVGVFSADGSSAAVPRSVVLVIDHSGSQFPYLQTSVEAAKMLVDKLGPRDRMAIVTDDVELLTDFTRDRALLKEKLDALLRRMREDKGGRSEHYSALMAALTELFDEEDLRPVVIFQADGEELLSLRGYKPRVRGVRERPFSFDDLLVAAERARATVYTVSPGVRFVGVSEDERLRRAKLDMANRVKAVRGTIDPARGAEQRGWSENYYRGWGAIWQRCQQAMADLARHTGGQAEYLERPEDAQGVYARVFEGIESRYVIGYYPTNRARDGKRRKVSVEVRGHPDYAVWGRKTYFAPGP